MSPIPAWKLRRMMRDDRAHFVYSLFDANGEPVYVGMALDVPKRIRDHYNRTTWLTDVRTVKIAGPFRRPAAIAAEQDLIGRLQPRANVQYTVRDNRPAIAHRSAELARLGVTA